MDWNKQEIADVGHIIADIEAFKCDRAATASKSVISLSVSEAQDLKKDLVANGTSVHLLLRHLLYRMGFDVRRISRWRMEHKLTQALILQQYSPGSVPVSLGAARELTLRPRSDPLRQMEEWRSSGALLKPTFSRDPMTGTTEPLAWIAQYFDQQIPSDNTQVFDEVFMLQAYLPIQREYRVHSIEDRVIPGLTIERPTTVCFLDEETDGPSHFVQNILDRLPPGLTKDSMYSWDVALTEKNTFMIIEANPAGIHEFATPGFHCSGFFQGPWTFLTVPLLLAHISERYRVDIEINPGLQTQAMGYTLYYWMKRFWEGRQNAVHILSALQDGRVKRTLTTHLNIDPEATAEQNGVSWLLQVLEEVAQKVGMSGAPAT
jgi:hypothetical protein